MTTLNRKSSTTCGFLPVMLIACCAVLTFCAPVEQDYGPQDGVTTVYTIPWAGSLDEVLFKQAIQGISNREKPQVYLTADREGYPLWLEESRVKHGFTIQPVANIWDLYELFEDKIKGYVLYPNVVQEGNTEAINYAATLAGVLDAVPVTPQLEQAAINRGLSKLADTADYTDIAQIINLHKAKLNTKIFVNQDRDNWTVRDFGIKHRAITVYGYTYAHTPSGIANELPAVYDHLEPNAVMFGWGPGDEVLGAGGTSEHHVICIPSNHAINMSFYEAELSTTKFTQQQPLIDRDLKAQASKHYVSFSCSDGDNLQWLINTMPTEVDRWAHPNRTVPLGWPIAPALPRYAPIILEYMYKTARPTDNIISAGSGYGYIFPSLYDMEHLIPFVERTAAYMQRSDMHYLEILDHFFIGETSDAVFKAYLDNPHIKGLLYRAGSYYSHGRGFVKWINNKPVVSYRDALWHADYTVYNIPENEKKKDIYQLAYRLSQYPKDYTKIDGYTMVMVHVWSHYYESIQAVADWLAVNDPNVVIVTPATLMRLIEENVPKTNAYPEKNLLDTTWDYSSVEHLYQ